MGNYLSYGAVSGGANKRKSEEEEAAATDLDHAFAINPKRRRMQSTSDYIYKKLFEEGRDADVTVEALGKQWPLHRVYLCQSPYFHSMFSGQWKETGQDKILIKITDENINVNSFHMVLGSFYRDDVGIDSVNVISVLATALLLQMDPIIDICTAIMKETINVQTVLNYLSASQRYGVSEVNTACHQWLLQNLLTQVMEHPETLRCISTELMRDLIASPHLYAMQTEFSIYVMLKAWVFLKLNQGWYGAHENAIQEAHKFFQSRTEPHCFLESEGVEFAGVFSTLRLTYVVYHHLDIEMLQTDRIISPLWLQPACARQWYNMLRIDQGKDKGPTGVSEEDFDSWCMRCGRILTDGGHHIWRWTGYNFGLDLVMTHDGSSLKLKRNCRAEGHIPVGGHTTFRRHIMYRVTIASRNDREDIIYTKTTGVKSASLLKNEEVFVMLLGPEVKYPLMLSVNFLIVTPSGPSPLFGAAASTLSNADQSGSFNGLVGTVSTEEIS